MEKKEISARIAGWALQLQEFQYTLEHRRGDQMRHADALSRNPVVMVIESSLLDRLKCAQKKDARLQLIARLMEHGPYEDYVNERGVIFKLQPDGRKLLCIPKSIINELVRKVHEDGHFAARKMEDIIQREYYFPKIREACESCRNSCIKCILSERKLGKQEGLLNPLPIADGPLSAIHIDHLGPLVSTKKQYNYIFSIVDSFSKYIWLFPVKSTTTAEVLQKMEQYRTNFGNPAIIISDRGTAFTSNSFQDFCREQGIHHTLITTGVPRANGQVERIHRVIIPALSKLSIECPENWFKYVSTLQRFLNSTFQRSINRSPFEVMFGTKMRNPEDLRLAEIIQEEITTEFINERDTIRDKARENIFKVQQENRRIYNRKRKEATKYNVGDLVAIKKCQFATGEKLYPKFMGPYKVVRVGLNDRYDVERVGTHRGPQLTTSSADNMKPWSPYEDSEDSDVDGDADDGILADQA